MPEIFVPEAVESAQLDQFSEISNSEAGEKSGNERTKLFEMELPAARVALHLVQQGTPRRQSPWSASLAKRFFDCGCVLLALPLILPVLMLTAVAVWLTSEGPILFLQRRVGCHGRTFTIFKFRTLMHDSEVAYHAVTTADNQPFTLIGAFLRRWKLDELPQTANVLMGHMSLVGPRPKIPQHVNLSLPCRPGITGPPQLLLRVRKRFWTAYQSNIWRPTITPWCCLRSER